MKPMSEMSALDCQGVKGIFFDIDDTFTSSGKILPSAYSALWKGHEAGLRMVPITGRPAGWVDHIARMWPVDGVVGENGAFYFMMDGGKLKKVFLQSEEERAEGRHKLLAVRDEVLRLVPGCALASDQLYREADLAVDYCEDVKRLPQSEVDKIISIFEKAGATVKLSSIHVNGWFGDYDKTGMIARLLNDEYGEELSKASINKKYVFIGDSPNDEPLFSTFSLSVGVANISCFVDKMKTPPRFVTNSKGGEGFAEVVDHVLQNRK